MHSHQEKRPDTFFEGRPPFVYRKTRLRVLRSSNRVTDFPTLEIYSEIKQRRNFHATFWFHSLREIEISKV